jgi:hypothetical protein
MDIAKPSLRSAFSAGKAAASGAKARVVGEFTRRVGPPMFLTPVLVVFLRPVLLMTDLCSLNRCWSWANCESK